jgi:hypothetical protein
VGRLGGGNYSWKKDMECHGGHTGDRELETTDEGKNTMMYLRQLKVYTKGGAGRGDGRSALEAGWLEACSTHNESSQEHLKVSDKNADSWDYVRRVSSGHAPRRWTKHAVCTSSQSTPSGRFERVWGRIVDGAGR